LDAIDDLTGAQTRFANLPAGTRAIALPDNSYNRSSGFLKVFGRPESQSVCECERVKSSSLAQSLHLINSNEIKLKLSGGNSRAAQFGKDEKTDQEKVTQLYRIAFARNPDSRELKIALDYVNSSNADAPGKPVNQVKQQRENYQDLIWALMNTKEFLFNH